MARYAIVDSTNTVVNIVVGQPTDMPSGATAIVADGLRASPGDTYNPQAGVVTPRARSATEQERADLPTKLQQAIAAMSQIANDMDTLQAQATTMAGANVLITIAQQKKLYQAVADLAGAARDEARLLRGIVFQWYDP